MAARGDGSLTARTELRPHACGAVRDTGNAAAFRQNLNARATCRRGRAGRASRPATLVPAAPPQPRLQTCSRRAEDREPLVELLFAGRQQIKAVGHRASPLLVRERMRLVPVRMRKRSVIEQAARAPTDRSSRYRHFKPIASGMPSNGISPRRSSWFSAVTSTVIDACPVGERRPLHSAQQTNDMRIRRRL